MYLGCEHPDSSFYDYTSPITSSTKYQNFIVVGSLAREHTEGGPFWFPSLFMSSSIMYDNYQVDNVYHIKGINTENGSWMDFLFYKNYRTNCFIQKSFMSKGTVINSFTEGSFHV